MLASMEGHLEVVRCLVDAGADVEAKDDVSTTASQWQSVSKYWNIYTYCISYYYIYLHLCYRTVRRV